MVNVKHRVRIKVDGIAYDLKASQNPHEGLPKAVVKVLKDGDHLDDGTTTKQSTTAGADLAAANAEVAKLAEENAKLTKELGEVQAKADALAAEIEASKKAAK